MKNEIAPLSIAAIRSLVIDMTNKANSGHPGMALDATPALYALFHDHLVIDPEHPDFFNRDRFVLSAGHCSALLYALLHICGFALTMDDLKQFRQLGSLTPGHPEVTLTPGVDATSGPLGQGIGQAVGMAIAEEAIRAEYPEGEKLMNHYTYCLCGDGCLEEGVSQEAISLAGHLKLSKLILLYDANGSTLDGPTSDSLSENVAVRFIGSGWDVIDVKDGNSYEKMSKAIAKAKKHTFAPSVIIFHTRIGYGSDFEGTAKTHGAPLGIEDGNHAKARYGYKEPEFTVPASVYEDFKSSLLSRGKTAYQEYESTLKAYQAKRPEDYQHFVDARDRNINAYMPDGIKVTPGSKGMATRNASGKFLERLHASMPFAFGGSADVAGSTKTSVKGPTVFGPSNRAGRDVHWGIREFAMASAANGIALHGGLLPYCSTFFVFCDYAKPAFRMAAMEKLPVIYIFTHDSIFVGEDGMTHQPIDELPMLRSIPNFDVIRPCDTKEVEASWKLAIQSKETPTALILTRQSVPDLKGTDEEGVAKGAYFVYKPRGAKAEILATGSEVSLALDAAKILEEKGLPVSVVSFPSWKRFAEQNKFYQKSILNLAYEKRISLEAGSTFGWAKYAGYQIGIDTFGASAPEKDLRVRFGFTAEAIASKIEKILQ